MEERW